MDKNLTIEWLKKYGACDPAIKWVKKQADKSVSVLVDNALKSGKNLGWAKWMLLRMMGKGGRERWAIYIATEMLPYFERHRPGDMRPRNAIVNRSEYLRDRSRSRKERFKSLEGEAAQAASEASSAVASRAAAAISYINSAHSIFKEAIQVARYSDPQNPYDAGEKMKIHLLREGYRIYTEE